MSFFITVVTNYVCLLEQERWSVPPSFPLLPWEKGSLMSLRCDSTSWKTVCRFSGNRCPSPSQNKPGWTSKVRSIAGHCVTTITLKIHLKLRLSVFTCTNYMFFFLCHGCSFVFVVFLCYIRIYLVVQCTISFEHYLWCVITALVTLLMLTSCQRNHKCEVTDQTIRWKGGLVFRRQIQR